ncbi:MAG: FAD-dependent oxidoreductase [Cyanobacteria bacterium J06638_22]
MRVVIVGCGVVGAAIAYELSLLPSVQVTVLDRQPPAQDSTGAALGVLMGIISQKTKGRAWEMRQVSLRCYETLIPELEAATGETIPYNRQGILLLRLDANGAVADGHDNGEAKWRSLIDQRHRQGWQLEAWDAALVQERCPHVAPVVPAIYSPQDRQLHPTQLTHALVKAAQQNGVTFHFDAPVQALEWVAEGDRSRCTAVKTPQQRWAADWVILSAGLGSLPLLQAQPEPLRLVPVLGQALQVRLPKSMGNPDFQPVITGDDIHIVPLGNAEYWVGATVEFPPDGGELVADEAMLEQVWQRAIALCPALKEATILRTWSGRRPRPTNRPAPVIDYLTGSTNVVLATGHYRNGVLLAPATAEKVKALLALA